MFLKLRAPAIIIALALLALGLSACASDDSPPGVELAWHTYQGNTYTLVEYADRLALFDDSGAPVTEEAPARAVLHSYAWRLELDGLAEQDAELQQVQWLDATVAKTLPLSAELVDALDEIESLEANIPLIGKVSAQDALLNAYPEFADGIALLRDFDADLNDLARNVVAIAAAVIVIVDATAASELDGASLDAVFRSAISAAHELGVDNESIIEGVAMVIDLAEQLASVLIAASDLPIIGDSLSNYALIAAQFLDSLQALAGAVTDVSGGLDTLAGQYDDAVGATEQRLDKDTARWLSEPYDDKWPP